MSEGLSPEILCERPRVLMFTAPNASPKTLGGTHTFVVGNNPAYVIDPGPADSAYQDALAEWLRAADLGCAGILLTHFHPDHAPGALRLRELLRVPVIASPLFDADDAGIEPDRRLELDEHFDMRDDTLSAIATPGHSHDHMAFWLETARILFAGDTILGEGSTLVAPPEGDMLLYMQSLETIRALDPRLIAPGHGPVISETLKKIDEYVKHRTARERQLLTALESSPATPCELVERIYTDVGPQLQELALGSVLAQLSKLEREQRVSRSGDRFQIV